MIVSVENKGYELCVSYFDEQGEISYLHVPVEEAERYVYDYADTDGGYYDKRAVSQNFQSWDNRPVKVIRTTKLSKYRIEEILQTKSDLVVPAYEFNVPKKHFIDIETEITEGFADPELALNRVLSIAIATDRHRVFVFGLRDLDRDQHDEIEKEINAHFGKKFPSDKWSFSYHKFESEYDMLYTFFSEMKKRMFCISGWNVIGYDWKYLVNRAGRLKIDPSICSPSGRLLGKNRTPQHKLLVDYLDLVKKWDRVIKIKDNFKLDYIGEKAVGIAKIKYNGSLKDLYEQDFRKFIFYNAVDSALVHYIDKRLNTMLTFFKLANVTGVECERAFSPIHIMEALLGREYFKENKVFVDTFKGDGQQKDFEGAYVKDPIPGLHSYVACFDFASLYPSVMQQFNISPESYRGKREPMDGEIRTASGAVFQSKEDSALRKILKNYYGKRKEVKKKYLDVNKEIDDLEKMLR